MNKKFAWAGVSIALTMSVLFTGGCSVVRSSEPEGHLESKLSRETGASRLEPEISREPESTAFSQETENAAVEIPAAAGSELPSRYDARKDDRTAPVKNQGDLGTCWAFASLLAL